MKKKIDIIIPCHNEEDNVSILIDEIYKYIGNLGYEHGFIFVDDGSTDNTYKIVSELISEKKGIKVIKLSKNFGKEAAIMAGLQYCECDAAIIIDSDLQHPPHLLPSLISEWKNGAHIVDAVKTKRQKENIITRILILSSNWIMSQLTGMDFQGSSDYKLLDRRAIAALNTTNETNRVFRGLTNWIGFRHSQIEFKVDERKFGKTNWNWFKLFQLFVETVTSYSSKPLHVVTILGILFLLFSIILGAQTLYNKYFGGAISGFTTVILVVLISCSFIMISMGIIGIYLSKIYNEVKNRPIFIIEDTDTNTENELKS